MQLGQFTTRGELRPTFFAVDSNGDGECSWLREPESYIAFADDRESFRRIAVYGRDPAERTEAEGVSEMCV